MELDVSLEKELVDAIHDAIAITSINNIDLTKALIKKIKMLPLNIFTISEFREIILSKIE